MSTKAMTYKIYNKGFCTDWSHMRLADLISKSGNSSKPECYWNEPGFHVV